MKVCEAKARTPGHRPIRASDDARPPGSSSQLFAEQQSVSAFWRAARRIMTTKNQKPHQFLRKISTSLSTLDMSNRCRY